MYHGVQLSYTTRHRTVLMIFPLILQTTIIVQMMSTGGEGTQATSKEQFCCVTSAPASLIRYIPTLQWCYPFP